MKSSPATFKNKHLSLLLLAISVFSGCALMAKDAEETAANTALATVDVVLKQVTDCNDTIVIRSQSLNKSQLLEACSILIAQEDKFHQTFTTRGKPVADDNNIKMRANIYSSRDEFIKYATEHFNMPTNNGGMFLEGYPEKENNQAEFVAYERSEKIWNLKHEYNHYLDGRFNMYGDYCNGLHDDHAGPEFCPRPHLAYPHIVWWTEGLGEYLAWGQNNPKAVALAQDNSFALSELFRTSSNENTGTDRVYRWGYLAVRFMMEHHRDHIDDMLVHTREGNWAAYQALVNSWGTSLDKEFSLWLASLSVANNSQ